MKLKIVMVKEKSIMQQIFANTYEKLFECYNNCNVKQNRLTLTKTYGKKLTFCAAWKVFHPATA